MTYSTKLKKITVNTILHLTLKIFWRMWTSLRDRVMKRTKIMRQRC